MKLTNYEIYTYANNLVLAFNDGRQKLPIKINFYLQKNKKILLELAKEIEKSRMEIAQSYGELNEATAQYVVPDDQTAAANKELEDLFSLTQEVNIEVVDIDCIDEDLVLSTAQMEALMFMIDDN